MSHKFVAHHSQRRSDENRVYVGRPTKWGNPYVIGIDGTRAEVIEMYRRYIQHKPELITAVKKELRGKVLVCWCAPLPCHADVLAEIANSTSS